MKKLSLGIAVAAGLEFLAGPVNAADIPVKAPPPVVMPALYNWSGLYIGVEGGAVMGQRTDLDILHFHSGLIICVLVDDRSTSCPTFNAFNGGDFGHPLHGGFVGGEAGFNWQAPGSRWVFGIEGDGQWAELEEALTCPNPTFFCGSKIRDFETVRGRIGYAFGPTGSFLVYVTGGAAFASQSYSSGLLAAPFTTINEWERTVGWTIGGGAEYGITPWLSLKAEVLYINLNGKDYPGETVPCASSPFTSCTFEPVSIKHDFIAARMGLNWRLWWGKGKGPAPVVASY